MQRSQPAGSRLRLSPSGKALVAGLVLLLVAAPALFLVAVVTGAFWAVLAGVGSALSGLLALGQVFAPDRGSFRAGTKIWQNDGLPGGGGGGTC